MRLVTGRGEALELADGDPRLEGARIGLGALGVITQVTLRVVEAFGLEEITEVVSLDEALARLLEVAGREEFVKWFWLPHTARVAEYRYRRIEPLAARARVGHWVDQHFVNGLVFPAILGVGGRVPALVPAINRAVRVAYFRPGARSGRSDHMFNLAMPPRHRETEWSVGVEQGPDAVRELARLIDDRGLRVNFIQELRVVGADQAWLSPAHGRDSCYIGAYIGHGRDADAFIAGFCAAMRASGARPHWGKEMEASAAYLAGVYPQMGRFLQLRRELDPHGVFDNAFLRRSLGPLADA
jgi:FAD/FMN-containing dehydrogenase